MYINKILLQYLPFTNTELCITQHFTTIFFLFLSFSIVKALLIFLLRQEIQEKNVKGILLRAETTINLRINPKKV